MNEIFLLFYIYHTYRYILGENVELFDQILLGHSLCKYMKFPF